MTEWNPRTDPNVAAHIATEHERSSHGVTSLADIEYRLASIDRELGAIQSDLRHMSAYTILLSTLCSSLSSLVVSALTAYAVVQWFR